MTREEEQQRALEQVERAYNERQGQSDTSPMATMPTFDAAAIQPEEEKKDWEFACGVSGRSFDRNELFKEEVFSTFIKDQAKRLERRITVLDNTDYMNVGDNPCDTSKEIVMMIGLSTEEFYFHGDLNPSSDSVLHPRSISLYEGEDHNKHWYSGDHKIDLHPYPPSAEMVIKDRKKRVVAYVSSYTGVLIILPTHDSLCSMERIISLFTYVLDKYEEYIEKDLLPKNTTETLAMRKEVLAIKDSYSYFIENLNSSIANSACRNIENLRSSIDDLLRSLRTKRSELEKEVVWKESLIEKIGSEENKGKVESDTKTWVNLIEKNKYTKFRFDGDNIIGYTPVIKILDKYDVGSFQVRITLDGSIKCIQQVPEKMVDTYDHPHVNQGDPCWGNVNTSISDVVKELEFPIAFDFMHTFLSHYNPLNPYAKLYKWGSEDDKCGGRCGRTVEYCNCASGDYCQYCEEEHDNCECPTCPETGDTLEDDAGMSGMCEGCSANEDGCCIY